jgi:hypothetical protein
MRFTVPYVIASSVIALLSFVLLNFVIPIANRHRLEFEDKYMHGKHHFSDMHVHRQIQPGEFVYLESFNTSDNMGYKFALERFKSGKLEYKLNSEIVEWDSVKQNWLVKNYTERWFHRNGEKIKTGEKEFTIPLLKPNESKVINFDFFPNRIYKQSNIPVKIVISESYGKYGESKTYTVQLNTELKQQNEIIVQGTKQESIEIKSVSLLSDIDKNLPITNGNNSNAIAVIIGNSNYANTKSIAYAISDAQSMKNYLINVLGFKEGNILFKENATLGDFNTLFGTKENQKGRLANTIKENISDVFVFYAGHGAPGLKDNKGYFVPVECNPNYVENSGYSLDVFYQNLGQLKAKSLTIVLDACFSGANVFDKISPLTIKVIDPVLTMKNAVVIASSSGTEVSTWYDEKQHGMFTYFFLKAIQDKEHSDKNHDGTLTYQELYEYVSDRNEGVPYQAARIHGIEQHPTITGDMKEKAFIKY